MKKNVSFNTLYNFQKKLENNVLISSIRQGMVYAMPAFIIGSVALVLLYFPIQAYQVFLASLLKGQVVMILNDINIATFGIISPLLVLTISYSYSKQKNAHKEGDVMYLIVAMISFLIISDFRSESFNFNSFGVQGVFVAMCSCIFSCEMFSHLRVLFKKKNKMRVFSGSDGIFNRVASNMLPLVIVVIITALFEFVLTLLGVDNIQTGFSNLLCRTLGNSRSFGTGLLYVFLVAFLWIFGIHGSNSLEAVALTSFTEINGSIFSKAFNDVFVLMGGSGTALCLVLAVIIFSRNKRVRKISYSGIPLTVFNISEPVIFGLPVLLNPIFALPFVLTPLVCYCTSYLATLWGLIPVVVRDVPWTTPVLISGYIATGSIWGSVLQLINLVFGILIYAAFIRINDRFSDEMYVDGVKQLAKSLESAENNGKEITLLGRNSSLYSQMLAFDLYNASKNDEFKLYYQPQIDIDGKCYGAEGLLRYKHKVCGFVSPPLIIKIAQEMGTIRKLEQSIIEQACAFIKDYNYTGLISINVTADYIEDDSCVEFISNTIKRYGIAPEYLAIEITEETAIISKLDVLQNIEALRKEGIKIILDDFGMGHTSLLYIQEYKFDNVKITGELVKSILTNEKAKDIISSIVQLGRDLDFKVTAEYVENKEMRDILASLGCSSFQGYFYSKAIPCDEFIEYVTKQNGEEKNQKVDALDAVEATESIVEQCTTVLIESDTETCADTNSSDLDTEVDSKLNEACLDNDKKENE